MGLEADLFEPSTPFEARRNRFHDNETHALRASGGVCLAGEHDEVADLAVRDIGFLPIDHVMVAVAKRTRSQLLQVAAAVRLGEAKRSDQLAADHARQPFLLLFGCTEGQDVRGHHVGMYREARPRGARPPELFRQHDVIQKVGTGAAILFRYIGAQQAGLTGAAP